MREFDKHGCIILVQVVNDLTSLVDTDSLIAHRLFSLQASKPDRILHQSHSSFLINNIPRGVSALSIVPKADNSKQITRLYSIPKLRSDSIFPNVPSSSSSSPRLPKPFAQPHHPPLRPPLFLIPSPHLNRKQTHKQTTYIDLNKHIFCYHKDLVCYRKRACPVVAHRWLPFAGQLFESSMACPLCISSQNPRSIVRANFSVLGQFHSASWKQDV